MPTNTKKSVPTANVEANINNVIKAISIYFIYLIKLTVGDRGIGPLLPFLMPTQHFHASRTWRFTTKLISQYRPVIGGANLICPAIEVGYRFPI